MPFRWSTRDPSVGADGDGLTKKRGHCRPGPNSDGFHPQFSPRLRDRRRMIAYAGSLLGGPVAYRGVWPPCRYRPDLGNEAGGPSRTWRNTQKARQQNRLCSDGPVPMENGV